jgi:hypothetical protein
VSNSSFVCMCMIVLLSETTHIMIAVVLQPPFSNSCSSGTATERRGAASYYHT